MVEDQRLKPIVDYKDLKHLTTPCNNPPVPRRRRLFSIEKEAPIHPDLYRKISINISEGMSLKDVLPAIASKVGANISFEAMETKKIIYTASSKPFVDVIRELCELSDLRCEINNKTIKVVKDDPYHKSYVVNFLSLERSSENVIASTTDVFDQEKNDVNKKNQNNSSDTEVKVKSFINFWQELNENLKLILHDAKYSIHSQGGLIAVIGTSKHHERVRKYLETLEKVANTQVLIEAKIIEVTLKQEFMTGVDWSIMSNHIRAHGGFLNTIDAGDVRGLEIFNAKNVVLKNTSGLPLLDENGKVQTALHGFSALIKALETFGSTRVMSSPRITCMNNNTALIKVAENHVYFKVNFNYQQVPVVNNLNAVNNIQFRQYATSDIRTKPIGFIMPIQVCVKEGSDEVTLFVRPTISRRVRDAEDPAVSINAQCCADGSQAANFKPSTIKSYVPVIDVKEMDTVMKVQSGNIAILGGLMQVITTDKKATYPGFSKVKCLDDVAASRASQDEVRELVILIRATIVDDATPDHADNRVKNCYSNDPRP